MTQVAERSPDALDGAKIWAHSGDSHALEPADLWTSRLPKELAERAPRTERQDRFEYIYVDGQVISRQLNDLMDAIRPPGASDIEIRLRDLDNEGVRCQLAFPSMGFWTANIEDPELARATTHAYNEWALEEVIARQRRVIPTATVSIADIDDAVKELEWAAENGFQAVFLPTQVPEGREFGLDLWEPLWAAAEAARMVIAYHIGTGGATVVYRGPGGAVVNYMETTYPGMRVISHLVAGGALDRHPDLKVLVAEGGASWVPAIGDRMDEAYRQHGMFVRPKLSRLPSEIVRQQVYTSFQHDISAVQIIEATGYYNVMWGDDYPHLEGTYGHTQQTLHQLFDGVDDRIRDRVLRGSFEELFTVPEEEKGAAAPK
jgi:predicted TIM-barrel fold metal-dependent hydrolase